SQLWFSWLALTKAPELFMDDPDDPDDSQGTNDPRSVASDVYALGMVRVLANGQFRINM
ncbi:hypothetical protein FRC10_000415, partial [Ceratobasidium sp. 414]